MTNGQKAVIVIGIVSFVGLGIGTYLWFKPSASKKGKNTKDDNANKNSGGGNPPSKPSGGNTSAAPSSQPSTGFPLQVGSSGDNVVGLQKLLNSVGVSPQLTTDGAFGNLTKAAVISKMGWTNGVVQKADYDALVAQSQSAYPMQPMLPPQKSEPIKTVFGF